MFPFPSNFSTFYTSQFSPLSFSVYAPASLWPLSNPIVYIHLLSGFFRQLNFCKIHWPKNTNLLLCLLQENLFLMQAKAFQSYCFSTTRWPVKLKWLIWILSTFEICSSSISITSPPWSNLTIHAVSSAFSFFFFIRRPGENPSEWFNQTFSASSQAFSDASSVSVLA